MRFLDLLFTAVVNCMLLTLIKAGASTSTAEPAGRGRNKVALLIIDVQQCFLPGGSLAVPQGEEVIPVINQIRKEHRSQLDVVVVTQDWHCPKHVSFASQHPGVEPYSLLDLIYNKQGELCYGNNIDRSYPYAVNCESGNQKVISQIIWPDHCIQNVTSGPTSAEFSPLLTREPSDILIRKGDKCGVDSYSAFFDNGNFHQTALDSELKARGVGVVVVTGLALDYCVYYTSLDADRLGYRVLTVKDASRGVDPTTTKSALQKMRKMGVTLVTEAKLGEALQQLTGTARQLSASCFVCYLLLLVTAVVTSASFQ